MYSKQFNPFCIGDSRKVSNKGDNRLPYQNDRIGQNEMTFNRNAHELMNYGGGSNGNIGRSMSPARPNDNYNMNYRGGGNNSMGLEYGSQRMGFGGEQRPTSFDMAGYPTSTSMPYEGSPQVSSYPGATSTNPFQSIPFQSSSVGNIPYQTNNTGGMCFPTSPTMSFEYAYGNSGEMGGNGMAGRLVGGGCGEISNRNMQYVMGEAQNPTSFTGSNTNRRTAGSTVYEDSTAYRGSSSPGSFSGSSVPMNLQGSFQHMPVNYDNYNRQPVSPAEFSPNNMSVVPFKQSPPHNFQRCNGSPRDYMDMNYGANGKRLTGGGMPMGAQQQHQQHQQQQPQQQQQQQQQSFGYENNSYPQMRRYMY